MHGEPGTLPLKRIEFKGDDDVIYIYDYSLLKARQMKMAEAVYKYQLERKQKVAGSLGEAFISGIHDYDTYALSFLILKKSFDAKGKEIIEPFPAKVDVMSWEDSEQFQFAANLGADQEDNQQRAIEDFFTKPSRYMLGFAVRGNILSAFTQNRQSLNVLEQTIPQNPESSSSSGSSNEENSSDGSSSPSTTNGTGS